MHTRRRTASFFFFLSRSEKPPTNASIYTQAAEEILVSDFVRCYFSKGFFYPPLNFDYARRVLYFTKNTRVKTSLSEPGRESLKGIYPIFFRFQLATRISIV